MPKNLNDILSVTTQFTSLKTERDRYTPVWEDISHFVGISVNTDRMRTAASEGDKSQRLDEFVDDPTSAISVNQFGDYLLGIMWGTGDRAFTLKPSRYVLEKTDPKQVADYYAFATDQSLYHMNHNMAGFNASLRPYAYDQAAFGNSGIGIFPNEAFIEGIDDNALIFRNYGVDNAAIDEGKSGLVEIIYVNHFWNANRIVRDFASVDGTIDDKKVSQLPDKVQDAYKRQDHTTEFPVVFGTFPRHNFNPKLKGKRGARYQGVWFIDDATSNQILLEEDFAEFPIPFVRAIKVRGEKYGRSAGTILMSSIMSVNFMMGTAMEIMEKQADPSLGVFGNATFGDSAIDTSASGLTVFNPDLAGGKPPVFPLFDVGDPTGIISFLMPYLNDKISTGFKLDNLLDSAQSTREMTATESLQRFSIRGKSLSGILMQQKTEGLIPWVRRSVSILGDVGELGVNQALEEERAAVLLEANRAERIIPTEVLQTIAEGRPWFEIEFNNDLEKLTRTEVVDNLLRVVQSIQAVASMYPQIIEGVDWYKLVEDINEALGDNNGILIGAEEFKQQLAAGQAAQAAAAGLEAEASVASTGKDAATANKTNQEAVKNA